MKEGKVFEEAGMISLLEIGSQIAKLSISGYPTRDNKKTGWKTIQSKIKSHRVYSRYLRKTFWLEETGINPATWRDNLCYEGLSGKMREK